MPRGSKTGDLLLLAIAGVALWQVSASKAAQAKAAKAAASVGAPTPGISPVPPQYYSTPQGGPFQAGGLGYSPYAGFNGMGQQPGSQTGKFYG